MKLLIAFLFTCLFFVPAEQEKFRISIIQEGMIAMEEFIFTNDSVMTIANYANRSAPHPPSVRRALTAAETQRILSTLQATDFKTLSPYYTNYKEVDDGLEFTFEVTYGSQHKETQVYMTRVKSLLRLTDSLNTILPAETKIHYNEHYLENGY